MRKLETVRKIAKKCRSYEQLNALASAFKKANMRKDDLSVYCDIIFDDAGCPAGVKVIYVCWNPLFPDREYYWSEEYLMKREEIYYVPFPKYKSQG